MNNFLTNLITLLEIVVGGAFLFAGLMGHVGVFVFDALLSAIGFLVLIDGLQKIDNPEKRNNNKNKEENQN